MIKKILPFILIVLLFQCIKAQDEFITIWKPNAVSSPVNAPVAATNTQIWFPGKGENFTITWEEVGYPQHSGTLQNVTSALQILIDFGTPLNPDPSTTFYRLKVSNGNGTFRQLQFGTPNTYVFQHIVTSWKLFGSAEKLVDIEQWGKIHWDSMNAAFVECKNMNMTATDAPDLSGVTDASYMFHNAHKFFGNPSMASWNTSTIKNFRSMFGYSVTVGINTPTDLFNPPIGSWDTSSAENMSFMFNVRKAFNQNLNSWNVSNVTDMSYMFASCESFNQPVDQWNVSKVKNIAYMFHFIPVFNQSLATWDTSNVNNMEHIFHGNTAFDQPLQTWNVSKVTNMDTSFDSASSFNQPLDTWDTHNVTNMSYLFSNASSFNQSLEVWNLTSLTSAFRMISESGMDCSNYSRTLRGWAINSNTPNNIMLGALTPFAYSSDVSAFRDTLINKGWGLLGDVAGECRFLGVSDVQSTHSVTLFPNPADQIIYIKNLKGGRSYKIFDSSGRIALQNVLDRDYIDVGSLTSGNYILQLTTDRGSQILKFIKK
ncbi:BspA family leucine-rich repeat surface protein [Chryseobacterium herbae]|uniref:BspA family leucine-rich repeat surface protein n=1 Tax=Chryseobacterium herbae TaxID=2976476 RepID=A0ABT2IS92_9FLAO|nr:BspA family leucine-rich repeat surface protein [Chryseobacterium sp. pc1-10]MCT2561693.1 BspA family leucine-rich repeat surface protein [Chryseobacterium sp. pc1-10]